MFEGRVAVVTGGTRGIGLAITRALARESAHVAAVYCRRTQTAAACEDAHRGEGFSVSTHQGHVEDFEECQGVIGDVLATYGRVDFLINNAGITIDKTLRKMTYQDWNDVINVNLSGVFNMTKAVLDHMVERGSGRIVNISSVIGETGNIGQANYAASKAGIFGFTRSLALEMASKGVTVNVVAPGFVATEMVDAMPEAALAKVVERIPVKRLGRPEDVARVVRFLCEDESGYITGGAFHVNGGLAMY
jgi:acetoacetyl-CoA reductase